MRSRLTNAEFIDWVAYLKLKDERLEKWEWYAAQVPLVMAQLHGDPKKTKALRLSNFTLKNNVPKKAKPEALLHMIAQAFGAKVEKCNGN
jgi:hypothetical protein